MPRPTRGGQARGYGPGHVGRNALAVSLAAEKSIEERRVVEIAEILGAHQTHEH